MFPLKGAALAAGYRIGRAASRKTWPARVRRSQIPSRARHALTRPGPGRPRVRPPSGSSRRSSGSCPSKRPAESSSWSPRWPRSSWPTRPGARPTKPASRAARLSRREIRVRTQRRFPGQRRAHGRLLLRRRAGDQARAASSGELSDARAGRAPGRRRARRHARPGAASTSRSTPGTRGRARLGHSDGDGHRVRGRRPRAPGKTRAGAVADPPARARGHRRSGRDPRDRALLLVAASAWLDSRSRPAASC